MFVCDCDRDGVHLRFDSKRYACTAKRNSEPKLFVILNGLKMVLQITVASQLMLT